MSAACLTAADVVVRPLSENEFSLFQALIYRDAGIHLAPSKKALLTGRLSRRLRELRLTSFGAYYRRLNENSAEGAEERSRMLECILTHETRFFREQRQFEFLEQQVLPRWRAERGEKERSIRAWSAGCSTGEEPYSIAMTLLHELPSPSGWTIEVLATDLSGRVLDKARKAVWPLEKARDIPQQFLKAFMLCGSATQEGRMKAGPEIRSLVRFERLNLNRVPLPVDGPFDLIFCRNVLIYFDQTSRRRAIEQLLRHLAPAGYLFLGHAESLTGLTTAVRSVAPTVYVQSEGVSLTQDRNGQRRLS